MVRESLCFKPYQPGAVTKQPMAGPESAVGRLTRCRRVDAVAGLMRLAARQSATIMAGVFRLVLGGST